MENINIFVRSCSRALSRRDAEVVVLTSKRAEGDLREIYGSMGVTEVVFKLDAEQEKEQSAGTTWALFRDYMSSSTEVCMQTRYTQCARKIMRTCGHESFSHVGVRISVHTCTRSYRHRQTHLHSHTLTFIRRNRRRRARVHAHTCISQIYTKNSFFIFHTCETIQGRMHMGMCVCV